MNEDKKLIQFLIGLNEGYSTVRANILMMKPLPTTAQAYSIILYQESQKEVHSNYASITESSAFLNTGGQKWAPQRYSGTQKSGNPHVYGENKDDQYCRYFKKIGHLMVDCHRLIGYPGHYKINKQKKKGPQQANVANAAMTAQTREPSMRKGPVFGDAAKGLYVLKDDTSTVESNPTTSFVPVSSFVKNKVESSSLGSISSFFESSCQRAVCPVLLSPVCDTDSSMNKTALVSTMTDLSKL